MIRIVRIAIKANIQAFMDFFFAAELNTTSYNEQEVLQALKYFLPTQAALEDFYTSQYVAYLSGYEI